MHKNKEGFPFLDLICPLSKSMRSLDFCLNKEKCIFFTSAIKTLIQLVLIFFLFGHIIIIIIKWNYARASINVNRHSFSHSTKGINKDYHCLYFRAANASSPIFAYITHPEDGLPTKCKFLCI